MRRRARGDQRGLTVVYLAMSITVVMLAGAFAVDLGWWYIRAQHAQRAADAAALAGVVWMPGDFPKAVLAARESARSNGFDHGVNSITVDVSPGTNSRQLVVRITDGNVARFFSSLASKDKVSIGRQAVAQYEQPVPLGGAENELGGGHNGLHLSVNGYCTRRSDGDYLSSAYYHASNPANVFTCPAQSYESASPVPPLTKNPDYRPSGYTYVVSIPPQLSGAACTVASPPPTCSTTLNPVTIQVRDPALNLDLATAGGDQPNFPNPTSCGTSRQGTTSFHVFKADTTPLDDRDNVEAAPKVTYPAQTGTSAVWQNLYTVPAGSLAGRYQVRVASSADPTCSGWGNAFGIRAQVGPTFTLCNSIPGNSGFSSSCPQVHGLDAMSLRVQRTAEVLDCVGTTEVPGNRCTNFFLAQVDPVYAGRRMVITLFDPDEGARRLRVLAPKPGFPNGTPIGFSYKTTDPGSTSTNVSAGSSGLNVAAVSGVSPFNDKRLELSVTLPSATDLAANRGWFKVEYEVASTATSVTDRTTWGVTIKGAPIRLVA